MPRVYIEQPDSFKVQDFLNALFADQLPDFFLINPNTGLVIQNTQYNIPNLGLSRLSSQSQSKLGFALAHDTNSPARLDLDKKYHPEALLLLEVDEKSLPEDLEGETWVLQVLDQENIPAYQPIAVALAEHFDVSLMITPARRRDQDSKHLNEESAIGKPGVVPFCPIIVRKYKSL